MGTHPLFESDFDCLTDYMLSEEQREIDQNFFEKRLQASIKTLHPYALKWRIILALVTVCTVVFTYQWLNDPATSNTPLFVSLRSHKCFIISCIMLISSLTFGIHQRVVAPSILVQRIRYVLADYGMTLNQQGQLIL